MRWIVGSSLRFRFLIVAVGIAMLAFGAAQLRGMPVDAFPEFAPPRVEVQTLALGLTAKEVEELINTPLEQTLTGIPGLEVIRSKAVPQLSSIELLFRPGTDLLRVRQLVQERINAATPSLPTWAAPPFIMPATSSTSRVIKIGMSSNTVGILDLSTIAYWKVRARLLRVPGVANVALWGEHLEQYMVEVDPKRMRAQGVTLEHVMESTSSALDAGLLRFADGHRIGTGGFVETPNQRLAVEHILPIITPNDLSQVAIAERKGQSVRLADVAQVKKGTQGLVGDAVVNGNPGLLLIVEKYPWGNTLDVTRGVESALNEMEPGLPGIRFDTHVFRAANFIETSLHNLTVSLLIGALLVVFVLGAFLFEWRTALISVTSIPLSLVAAALVLEARGETVNVMVLAGFVIALGVVVDDAIIDIENIWRRLRQHGAAASRRSKARVVLEASLEVRSPIVYATLIIIAALIPVYLLHSLTGAFFRPLVLSYGLAVLASLLVALTITPALSLILLSRGRLDHRDPVTVRALKRGYAAMLTRAIHQPRWAYAAVAVTAAAGLAVVPFLGESLIPGFKERDFLSHIITKPGTSLPEERRIVTTEQRQLDSIPGVDHVGTHIGQAYLADEVVGVNFGEHWIAMSDSAPYDETQAAIEDKVAQLPGVFQNVETYLNERIDEVLAGSSEPIDVRIFGSDLKLIRQKADELRDKIADLDGVDVAFVEFQEGVPQMEVKVNLAAAQRYGVKPGDVRRAAATLVESEEVGDIFRGGRAYDVHVWSTPETRRNIESIYDLPIDTPGGGHVLLGRVARLQIKPLPNVIHHEQTQRVIDVLVDVKGRDLGSVAREVQETVENTSFPLGYHAEVLGEYKERQSAQKRLLLYGIGSAVAIFLLLQASFGSFRLAALSFVTLPMALVGGALAAWLGGGVLSLGSLVGFYTVFGIAARNGILMINHFQHLEQEEGMAFGRALVLRGALERLSPILMTTLATGLALVPLVVSGDVPG
ncbi:MAG TPA: efflux RND transporter permease subunit, partial [Gaiellaceae bacterium]|nr:efflux RND transporter permease subunit [Gaiellaceae bacterium]